MADEERPEELDVMGLVMPFVVCASKGGPYDDASFVAGFECGQIDRQLGQEAPRRYAPDLPVHAGNVPQLDLIAMRNGYVVTFEDSMTEGWVYAVFERMDEAEGTIS